MNAYDLERRINVALSIAGSALTLYMVTRIAFGPDAFARVKMHTYLVVSRTAKRGSDVLTTIASNADTAYHHTRNVVV